MQKPSAKKPTAAAFGSHRTPHGPSWNAGTRSAKTSDDSSQCTAKLERGRLAHAGEVQTQNAEKLK